MHQIIFLFLLVIISPQSSSLYAQLFGGQIIPPSLESSYPLGSVFCASGPTQIVEVLNPVTGRIWMDRNLGASRAAISSTDALAYGDLYQWGRRSDGHQCRTSPVIATLSSIDQPPHGDFITNSNVIPVNNVDWRIPSNNNLWQGLNGINNPCPTGFRLPTVVELDNERSTWSSNNHIGGFNSPLSFSLGGLRYEDGTLAGVNSWGVYWTSNTILMPLRSTYLIIYSSPLNVTGNGNAFRARGLSVRCIKN